MQLPINQPLRYPSMSKNHFSRNNHSGFTLLEILVVVMIVGVLCAIAAPLWLAFIDIVRLNIAKDQEYRAIRQAQSEASHQKLTWQASFRQQDDGTVQWAVHPATVNPTNAQWQSLDPNIVLDDESTLQQRNGVRQIEFDFKGTVRKPPLGRITIASKYGGNAKRCVYVSTILGAMRTGKEHPRPKNGDFCY